MEFDPRPTMKNDCYGMKNANARGEYPHCRRDSLCKCEMCMESMQATMDLRSPNSLCSSITDWSESPPKNYASPYPYSSVDSCGSSSFYEVKKNRSLKAEMSQNKSRTGNTRVSSTTAGSTSKLGPDYVSDDGPVITERKKGILFGDVAYDGSMTSEIESKDGSIEAEVERKRGILFRDVADNESLGSEIIETNNGGRDGEENPRYEEELDERDGLVDMVDGGEENRRDEEELDEPGELVDMVDDGEENPRDGEELDDMVDEIERRMVLEIENKIVEMHSDWMAWTNWTYSTIDEIKRKVAVEIKMKITEIETRNNTMLDDVAKARVTAEDPLGKRILMYIDAIEDIEREREIICGKRTEDGSLEAQIESKNFLGDPADEKKENTLSSDATDVGAVIAEGEKKNILFGDATEEGSIIAQRECTTMVGDEADDGSMTTTIERNGNLVGDPPGEASIRARIDTTNNNLLGDAADDGLVTSEIEWKEESLLGDVADDGATTVQIEGETEISFADTADDESMENTSFADVADDLSVTPENRRRKNMWFGETIDDERRKRNIWSGIILFLLLIEFILPWSLSGLFKLSLTADKLKDISVESMERRRLSDRLDFVARKLSRIVPGQVMNCSGSDSAWKLQHEGLLVYSHCTLYSSMVEEVSLWGFPGQTAGVMGRRITDRSLTIMSGRMIEWYEGKTDYAVHQEGDSWTHEMLTASVVQMDGKTWILEYRPATILRGGGLVSWALRFLKWLTGVICERVILNYGSFLQSKSSVGHIHGDLRAPS